METKKYIQINMDVYIWIDCFFYGFWILEDELLKYNISGIHFEHSKKRRFINKKLLK